MKTLFYLNGKKITRKAALELVPESTLDRYIEAARHQYWEDPLVENSFMVHGGLMAIRFW